MDSSPNTDPASLPPSGKNTPALSGTLADFFAESPLRNSGLIIERDPEKPRDVDL